MIKISRFSASGFQAQVQSHLRDSIEFLLNTPLTEYPKHLRSFIQDSQKEVNPDWINQCEGFWAFVGEASSLDPQEVRFQLNHLSAQARAQRQWFVTEADPFLKVYPAHRALKGDPVFLKDVPPGSAVYVFQGSF